MSEALYQQVIGKTPGALVPPRPVDELVPPSLNGALETALASHPAILAARFAHSAALSQVDVARGQFLPSVDLNAGVTKQYDYYSRGDTLFDRYVLGTVSIPLFDGETFSQVRQAKEIASQRQMESDAAAAQVRAALMTSWGALKAAKQQMVTSKKQLAAGLRELTDMTEQYRYGQKSLTDVLLAQEDLLDAGTSLISARHDRVVATFAVARAVGALKIDSLSSNLDDRKASIPAVPFPNPAGLDSMHADSSMAAPALDGADCLRPCQPPPKGSIEGGTDLRGSVR